MPVKRISWEQFRIYADLPLLAPRELLYIYPHLFRAIGPTLPYI